MSKKYKLIKEYPGSPKLNHIAICDENNFETQDIDIYPEFWELVKEKEWKIISAIPAKGNNSGKGPQYVTNNIINEYWVIYSIKRLFDNEVFTLGDKIKVKGNYEETKEIKTFSEDEYGCYINGVELNRIEKVIPKELFITEDGIEIFEGDKYYEVVLINNSYNVRDMIGHKDSIPAKEYYITFSTEKAAKDYIEMNKPMYSKKQIMDAALIKYVTGTILLHIKDIK